MSREAEAAGASIVFAPVVEEMYPGYPQPPATVVDVRGVSEGLEGASRPGHFCGVATVVAKLFALAGRCRAYFGEKDFQQLAVVRALTEGLCLPVQVVACPTVREVDGVALSSRNTRLSPAERRAAVALYRCLQAGRGALEGGERDLDVVRGLMRSVMEAEPLVDCDYAEVVDTRTLRRPEVAAGELRLLVAANVGPVRLIDNVGVVVKPARRRAALRRRARRRARRPARQRTPERSAEGMRRRMMKSKIHRAIVTGANPDYMGSISLDPKLMCLADIFEYEQVAVLDIDNGARFETYAIVGGPGEVCLNGAAAKLVDRGDKVIVITYADYEEAELETLVPTIVHVDSSNTPVDVVGAQLDAELSRITGD